MRRAVRVCGWFIALSACVLGTRPGWARDLSPEEMAVLVARTYEKGDRDTFRALARKDEPDPWYTVDLLCEEEAFDVAEAFAKAAPRKDTETLSAYVSWRRENPVPARVRRVALSVFELKDENAYVEALALIDLLDQNRDDLIAELDSARGDCLSRLGRHDEAAAAYLSAYEAAVRIGWWARAAEALGDSAWCARWAMDFRTAKARYEQQLVLQRSRGKRVAEAQALGELAVLLTDMGDYERALAVAHAQRDLVEALGLVWGTAWARRTLGRIHARVGRHADALEELEAAREAFVEEGDWKEVAATVSQLSTLALQMGRLAEARALTEKALEIRRDLGLRFSVLEDVERLAAIAHAERDYVEAVKLYRRAGLLRDAFDDEAGVARIRLAGSRVFLDASQPEKAGEHLREARKTFEVLGDVDGLAATCALLGRLAREEGDLAAARAHLDEALAFAEQTGSAYRIVRILEPLADLCLERSEPAEALQFARRALDLGAGMLGRLPEEEGASARETWAKLYEVGTKAALALGDRVAVLQFLERSRAGQLLDSLMRRDRTGIALPDELRRAEVDARSEEARAAAVLRRVRAKGNRARIALAEKELDAARDAVGEVIARIRREEKSTADLIYPEVASAADLQARLRPDEALVVYGLVDQDALAYVVTRTSKRLARLGPVQAIEERALKVLAPDAGLTVRGLRERRPAEGGEDRAGLEARAQELRALLIDPLALTPATRRLLVAPQGILSYLPFALFASDRDVVYVPSGTTWLLLASEEVAQGKKVLALGDPDYRTHRSRPRPAPKGARERFGLQLTPLPGTRKEVKAIGDVVLVGEAATERGFAEAVAKRPRWRSVHLACHGYADHAEPMLSHLALAVDPENDGFLTAREVFRLRIPADLVVLSACETGRGRLYSQEGIVGLMRAFMFAGAPRVLVSLWRVDDNATQALMRKFYELWNPEEGPGLGAAAALRAAQAHLRKQERWSHPYYWAGWVLWGVGD